MASRSVHSPECWQMPRLSKIVSFLARVGVAVVGDPLGILGVLEAGAGVAAVAPRLDRRPAAAAQRQLRGGPLSGTEVIDQPRHVGHQVGPVMGRLDPGREPGLELPQFGAARIGLAGPDEPARRDPGARRWPRRVPAGSRRPGPGGPAVRWRSWSSSQTRSAAAIPAGAARRPAAAPAARSRPRPGAPPGRRRRPGQRVRERPEHAVGQPRHDQRLVRGVTALACRGRWSRSSTPSSNSSARPGRAR